MLRSSSSSDYGRWNVRSCSVDSEMPVSCSIMIHVFVVISCLLCPLPPFKPPPPRPPPPPFDGITLFSSHYCTRHGSARLSLPMFVCFDDLKPRIFSLHSNVYFTLEDGNHKLSLICFANLPNKLLGNLLADIVLSGLIGLCHSFIKWHEF